MILKKLLKFCGISKIPRTSTQRLKKRHVNTGFKGFGMMNFSNKSSKMNKAYTFVRPFFHFLHISNYT